ncbi:MAG TPA: HipA domain-containing protein [Polyangiaceae bacterium]
MRPWEELDVSDWPHVLEENRGRRVKAWVQSPSGAHWLRKEPKESRPYEVAIEALMLRLADEVGLVAANGSVCTWQEHGIQKRGLAVELFLDRDREQLILGSTCMRRDDAAYDPEAKWAHTLVRVRSVLEAAGGSHLLVAFAQLVAFDAWVGNADRHQENWGTIEPTGAGDSRLTPMYDPAACLGAELLDGDRHLAETTCPTDKLMRYVGRCPSGFGDGSAPITLEQAVREAASWPEWQNNVRAWVAAFAKGMDTFEAFLPTVPSSWLPPHRKLFALRLLDHRLRWLEGLI